MVFGLSEKEKKEKRVRKFAGDIIIRKVVAKEKVKQRIIAFEERKARAVARARNPLSKRFRGIAVKAGKRARKDIGKSLRGFAQKVGKPKESEKETLVILGGQPRRVKGRVRIVQPADTALGGGFGEGLGLNVDLLGESSKRKTKQKGFKPMRFF